MCHCGDHYCDLNPEQNSWANARHTELFLSDEWMKKIPNAVERDIFLKRVVREELEAKFTTQSPAP